MNRPGRIQRQRARGWRMPEGAVYVGRPGRWGNPYRVSPAIDSDYCRIPAIPTPEAAVLLFRRRLNRVLETNPAYLEPLRGKALCCWCPPDRPCHADVLLDLANREPAP